ncbi:zinc finger protein 513-like [Penaeus monodon]|uniref:zinc finger protein 513-like n=1 Tax=Penaeus monodon TaxID=6687 RepID=UPI0018A71456|nr:zinc finger protein 513-like [Penaeus monodon]
MCERILERSPMPALSAHTDQGNKVASRDMCIHITTKVSVDHNILGTSEGRPTKTIGIAEAIGATGCKNFSSATPKIRSCPYCPFTTTIATQLSEHLRSHAVRELFPCPHCPFQCFQVESIRAHIRTHTGEKPFGCAYCSYRSAQKGNMKRHVLKHHT